MANANGDGGPDPAVTDPPAEGGAEVVGPALVSTDLPEDPDEMIVLLQERLETAQEEASTYLDDLKRVAADFDNYRRRSIKEQAALTDRAAERIVRQLMPVLDSFDAAVGFQPTEDGERQLLSGMLNTREQLLKALEQEGLEPIPALGEEFDPEVHEAVGAPQDGGRLVVSQELRRGYRLKGKLLRPSLVMLESER